MPTCESLIGKRNVAVAGGIAGGVAGGWQPHFAAIGADDRVFVHLEGNADAGSEIEILGNLWCAGLKLRRVCDQHRSRVELAALHPGWNGSIGGQSGGRETRREVVTGINRKQ